MKKAVIRVKSYISKYERHISSAALLGGFILDSLTLQRIDFLFENLVIIFYITIAGFGILILNLFEANKIRGKFFAGLYKIMPVAIQFAIGGLFSGFLVFYFRSASLIAAWPFVFLLLGLLIGNELLKKYYERTVFNITVYFFCIFLFFIFAVPTYLGRMGDDIFLLSGGISLIIIALFIGLLYWLVPSSIKPTKKLIIAGVGGIFIFINMLYFTNIIPPIPLALKDIGVYHSVQRTLGGYSIIDEIEQKNFWQYFQPKKMHVSEGQRLYVYSAVFAPTALSTNIVHRWQHYDEVQKSWVTMTHSSFPINGGRDAGYRGYSWKAGLRAGLWRVSVETPRGQLIGRTTFRVEHVSVPPILETRVHQ